MSKKIDEFFKEGVIIDTFRDLINSNEEKSIKDLIDFSINHLIDNNLPLDLSIIPDALKTIAKLSLYRNTKMIDTFIQSLNYNDDKMKAKGEKAKRKLKDKTKDNKMINAILMYLDKYDDEEKAKWLGMVFNSLLHDKITQDEFFYFAFSIDKLFYQDILFLIETNGKTIEFKDKTNVITIGNDLINIYDIKDKWNYSKCMRLESIGLIERKDDIIEDENKRLRSIITKDKTFLITDQAKTLINILNV